MNLTFRRTLVTVSASLMAVALVIVALVAWNQALAWSVRATRPEVASWAIRSGAVAAGAMAQLLLLTFVTVHGRAISNALLRLGVGVVASVALVSAVALGLAGR
jgi:hypothetical protein